MVHNFSALLDESGFFLRRDALAAGFSDRQLREARARRDIVRFRQGAYADQDHWEAMSPRDRHLLRGRAVIRRAGTSVVLSHFSAVAAWGAPLWQIDLEDVHVTRLDERAGRREAGVAQHRGRLEAEDVRARDGICVTSPARTAVDITAVLGLEHSLPILDWLLAQRLADRAAMRTCAKRRRHDAGTLGTLIAIALADGRAESVAESRLRYLCWKFGLPKPEVNHEVRDRRGRVVARVDLAWPELGVFVEFDGREKYVRFRRPGEDLTDYLLRQNERERLVVSLTGWRCMRVRWRHLEAPERLAAWLGSVLAGAPVYDNHLRW